MYMEEDPPPSQKKEERKKGNGEKKDPMGGLVSLGNYRWRLTAYGGEGRRCNDLEKFQMT